MENQDPTQTPPTGEDEDDAGPEIGWWSAFGAVLLGAGFVVHMMFVGIGDQPTSGLHRRLHFFFVLLGGLGVAGLALAALARMGKPKPKPPAAQVSPRPTQHDLSVSERTQDPAAGGNDRRMGAQVS
jgi:hypothetical protein